MQLIEALRAAAIAILDYERARGRVQPPTAFTFIYPATRDAILKDTREAHEALDLARTRLAALIAALPHTAEEMALALTPAAARSAELRDRLRTAREALPFGHAFPLCNWLLQTAHDLQHAPAEDS